MGKKYLMKENKVIVILKTRRFDSVDSAVIISSVSKTLQNCKIQLCTALLTIVMMTSESMLSKRRVFTITVALFSRGK